MKTLIKIILLLLVAPGLMPVAANETGNNVEFNGFAENVKPDTLFSGSFIKVDTFNLKILPPSSGVQFYEDGIIYLTSSKVESRMLQEHVSFGKTDAKYAVLKDSILENPRIFSPEMSFPFPCEAVTFSKDFKTMYFTKYSEAEGVEKIFRAAFSSGDGNPGKWTMDENPLSFCTGKSIYTHPALSADGKIMIFCSNRTGTLGGMDIFITQDEGGNWSEPKNLGDAINTRLDEMYPYLDSENNLFYSSNGIFGYGGYDIFLCKFKGNTWETPVNVIPINTSFDDVAFTIEKTKGKSAFYTIKEKSGKRSIKLLKVSLTGRDGADKMLTLSQFFMNPESRNIVMIVTEPAVEATDRRTAVERARTSESRGKADNIVYRVQILTSFNPKTRALINLEGKDYSIYEYLYSGAYRLCVGEFSTIAPAIELRNKFIQNDYPQATVVVFRNNVRSFDPELLEAQAVPSGVAPAEKPVTIEAGRQAVPVLPAAEEVKKEIPVPEVKKPEPVKPPVKEPETRKPEPAPTAITGTTEKKNVVVYRVQIGTSNTSKGSRKITINNTSYDTFEYFYAGAYRTCIGEFSTLAPAKVLQNTCRASGNSQAFVVAFKNNVRSTDPALFK